MELTEKEIFLIKEVGKEMNLEEVENLISILKREIENRQEILRIMIRAKEKK